MTFLINDTHTHAVCNNNSGVKNEGERHDAAADGPRYDALQYSHADSVGVVEGIGYPTCNWGVVVLLIGHRTESVSGTQFQYPANFGSVSRSRVVCKPNTRIAFS